MRRKREVGNGYKVSRTIGQGIKDRSLKKNVRYLGEKKKRTRGTPENTGIDRIKVSYVYV